MKDELAELEEDVNAFSAAIGNNKYGDAFVLLQKRAGLIFGIMVPLFVLIRWPAGVAAVLRVAVALITLAFTNVLRYRAFFGPFIAYFHRVAVTMWRRMAARARERVQQEKQQQKQQQRSDSRRGSGRRPRK